MSSPMSSVQEVRIYADACSDRYALKQEGAPWVKEFSSLPEAIRYLTKMRSGTCNVTVHDGQGFPLTRLVVRAS